MNLEATSETDNEITKFLSLFGDLDELFFFQAVDDLKQNRPSSPMFSNFENAKKYLHALNGEQFGICFCVNELVEGATARNATSIARVRALFVDLDGSPLESVSTFALQPHCIIESSPGKYHAYWLVKDVTLSEFANLQRKLAKKFHGDLSICDLSRVMRLPGFVHHKGDPFVSRIIEINEHLSFYVSKQFHDCLESESSENKLETVSNCASSEAFCLNADLTDILGALDAIPSDVRADRETWLRVGMALKAELGDIPNAFKTWDNWSKGAPNYGGTQKAWSSFKRGGVTILTLFEIAKKYGYHGQDKSPRKETIDIGQLMGRFDTDDLGAISSTELLTTCVEQSDQILADIFDAGDKVLVVAPSKMRKTYFVLQLALSLASGRDFLKFRTVRPRRVLFVQLEVKAAHFKKRFQQVANHLKLSSSDLDDRLIVVNGRGRKLDLAQIAVKAKTWGAEVVIFDPLYQILDGDENSAADIKPVLRTFSAIAESTGAAVLYVHHDAKGAASDRNIRDRGAGSNILGRDYDCCFALAQHAIEPDSSVLQILLRNYKPQDDCVITWANAGFYVSEVLEPVTKQPILKKYQKPEMSVEHLEQAIIKKFGGQEIQKELFEHAIKQTFAASRELTRAAIASMLAAGSASETKYNPKTGEKKKIKINVRNVGDVRGNIDSANIADIGREC